MSAEFEQHVTDRYSVDTPFGVAHYVELDMYDPQLMLENTPLGNIKEKHHTKAYHHGVSMVYSHELVSFTTQLLMLSISGGSKENQQEIIKSFGEFLGTSTKRMKWEHISELGRYKRDMYIWRVDLATSQ